MFDSKKYWNDRYIQGGNSGAGSYNNLAENKASVINSFINEKNIETLIDYGVGDGNQLKLFNTENLIYTGIDVSDFIISKCKEEFKEDKTKNFIHSDNINNELKGDLVLSCDVIYNLIEEDVYHKYIKNLFLMSKKYVIIYAPNINYNETSHVKKGEFIEYIFDNYPNFNLVKRIKKNIGCPFYIFQKNDTYIPTISKNILQVTKENPVNCTVVNKIKKILDGYSYYWFNDENMYRYIQNNNLEEFPNIINHIKSLSMGQHKADIFRYYWLYINGGIFMDDDLMIEKEIDFKNNTFVSVKSYHTNKNILFNGFIACSKFNPIIYKALKQSYLTSNTNLLMNYHLFCGQFYTIYKNLNKNQNTFLLQEVKSPEFKEGVKIYYNEDHILTHWCYSKKIPMDDICDEDNRDDMCVFQRVYRNNIWGEDNCDSYKGTSGPGSKLSYNIEYISQIREFIDKNNIKTIVDLGCGDFLCGDKLYSDKDILYTGYDIYPDVINYNSKKFDNSKYKFLCLDFYRFKDQIKNSDLCIIKDVLQHWPLSYINNFLNYIVGKFSYIIICNCCTNSRDNVDIKIGHCRHLSIYNYPLKTYNAKLLFKYNTKEVSLIKKQDSIIPVYISITSIYSNQDILLQTLKSMIKQTRLPDKVFLYLSEEPYLLDDGFKDKKITNTNLLKFINDNSIIEIKWVKNTGSYRKLLPLLKNKWYEDCIIITIDDDSFYIPNLIENLVNDYNKHKCVIGYRGFTPLFDKLENFDYSKRNKSQHLSSYNFFTGKGSILYKPQFFHKTQDLIFNDKIYLDTCSTCDDIWFYIIRLLNKVNGYLCEKNWEVKDLSNNGLFIYFNSKNNNNISFKNTIKKLKESGYNFE